MTIGLSVWSLSVVILVASAVKNLVVKNLAQEGSSELKIFIYAGKKDGEPVFGRYNGCYCYERVHYFLPT